MVACVTAEAEINLKAWEVGDLLRKELNLPECNDAGDLLKPKEILVLAKERLGSAAAALDDEPSTVKEELRATRAVVRRLPAAFWTDDETKIRLGSSNDELLTRILYKPATAGGFATAIACRCLKPNVINTKSIDSRGAPVIDGFTVLRGAGAYCTLDSEMESLGKAFRTERDCEKIGDCTFRIQERTQPAPGQVVMTGKGTKCEARFVGLLTPKWCLVAIFQHAGPEAEEETTKIFEDMRLELPSK